MHLRILISLVVLCCSKCVVSASDEGSSSPRTWFSEYYRPKQSNNREGELSQSLPAKFDVWSKAFDFRRHSRKVRFAKLNTEPLLTDSAGQYSLKRPHKQVNPAGNSRRKKLKSSRTESYAYPSSETSDVYVSSTESEEESPPIAPLSYEFLIKKKWRSLFKPGFNVFDVNGTEPLFNIDSAKTKLGALNMYLKSSEYYSKYPESVFHSYHLSLAADFIAMAEGKSERRWENYKTVLHYYDQELVDYHQASLQSMTGIFSRRWNYTLTTSAMTFSVLSNFARTRVRVTATSVNSKMIIQHRESREIDPIDPPGPITGMRKTPSVTAFVGVPDERSEIELPKTPVFTCKKRKRSYIFLPNRWICTGMYGQFGIDPILGMLVIASLDRNPGW